LLDGGFAVWEGGTQFGGESVKGAVSVAFRCFLCLPVSFFVAFHFLVAWDPVCRDPYVAVFFLRAGDFVVQDVKEVVAGGGVD
jgi:hypothetical protein